MAGDSYSLSEVAELLGLSKRTLQRQIREGAFPGRFLAPSAHGMEMRIPASDLEVDTRAGSMSLRPRSSHEFTESEVASISSVPIQPARGEVEPGDLEVLRDGIIAIVREEREVFLREVRSGLERRDARAQHQFEELRLALREVQEHLVQVREQLRSKDARGSVGWSEVIGGGSSGFDVDGLLSEIAELEAMLGLADS